MLASSLIIYLIVPVNFASGVGYVTWRSIEQSNSNVGTAVGGNTLNGTITNVATSMVVTSNSGYPPPPFVVTCGTGGTEAILVTAVSGLTWTITRGYQGSTAAGCTTGAAISGPVSYRVQFVPATPASSIQAIVIDFCSDSPIYNSTTCTQPTGMNTGPSGATVAVVPTGSISGISASMFTTNVPNNTSRDSIIFSNTGTGYTPLAATTISATTPITSGAQTSFTVTSSANYPVAQTNNPASWFYINVTNGTTETMQVTNVSGLVWTVNRAQLGTSALSAAPATTPISQPPIAFTVQGMTNPTSTGALYARIYTFSTYSGASGANTFATASPLTATTYSTAATNNIDSGGVALYITNSLTVNAKVQEYLQFCVYSNITATAAPCSLSGSTVTLGNSSGILSIASAYVDSSTRFDIATNASGYAAVTFTGLPLSNGSLLIENSGASGTGTVAATSYTSSVGTDQFGLCVTAAGAGNQATNYTSTNLLSTVNPTYFTGTCPSTLALSAVYAGSDHFGLNIAQAGSVYGDLLAIQKPGTGSTGMISFIGNVAASQLAGIYSTTFNFVASGTY